MPDRLPPWLARAKAGWLRFWRSEDSKVAAVRDVLVAGTVVLLLLGGIWIYTGQSFPSQAPLVVVESGSMMHGRFGPCTDGSHSCDAFPDPGFSRVGTIDPGDLVLVKEVDGADDVETAFGAGSRDGYGGHGDVIVFKRPTSSGASTPIIHRAMLYIQAVPEGCQPGAVTGERCTYVIPETCAESFGNHVREGSGDWRKYCQGSPDPITLNLERDGLFLKLDRYPCSGTCPPFHSGFITKGDNNDQHDQTQSYQGEVPPSGAILCCPVRTEWIVGKARGEIPWFGLIKLAIYGNKNYECGRGERCSDPTRSDQWTILRATAPWDIWVALFLSIGALIAAPMAFDFALNQWRRRREKRPPSQ